MKGKLQRHQLSGSSSEKSTGFSTNITKVKGRPLYGSGLFIQFRAALSAAKSRQACLDISNQGRIAGLIYACKVFFRK
jgi:hypothetical protein